VAKTGILSYRGVRRLVSLYARTPFGIFSPSARWRRALMVLQIVWQRRKHRAVIGYMENFRRARRPRATIALQNLTFHELLLGCLPSLRMHALALTRHRADAEDLVHSAVASALAAEASFELGTNFRAWITRILRNRFFSNIRRRRETVDINDAPVLALSRSGGQEEGFAIHELHRCLAHLPSDQRVILLMITVQGLSYEDASAELGVAIGTLKCRVFRARRQLRQMMMGEAQIRQPQEHLSAKQFPRLSKTVSPRPVAASTDRLGGM